MRLKEILFFFVYVFASFEKTSQLRYVLLIHSGAYVIRRPKRTSVCLSSTYEEEEEEDKINRKK